MKCNNFFVTYIQEEEHEKKRQKLINSSGTNALNIEADSVNNDFKRELKFYRQAQATVLEVIPRLKSMGVPTKRPEDYFAQMAKTDGHMNKVSMNVKLKIVYIFLSFVLIVKIFYIRISLK